MDQQQPEPVSSPEKQGKKIKNPLENLKFGASLEKAAAFTRDHWGILAIILIILVSMHVRLIDYRWPYLRNIDSYNFLRDMELIVENNGVFPGVDPLMLAPEGLYKGIGTLYPYMGAYFYMLYRNFSPEAQIWQVMIWFPPLLASLAAVPMYFLTKKLYDKKAGVIAALLIVFDASIMARTLGGDPDNDNVVILLPLLIITAFIYLQDYMSKKERFDKKPIIFSVLLGTVLAGWIWTWGGYWFVIWIMIGFVVVKVLAGLLHERNPKKIIPPHKNGILSFVLVMLTAIIIMTVFIDRAFIFGLFSQLGSIAHFGDIKSEIGSTFPNVYVSVAELQSAGGLNDIIRRIGPPFFTSLFALLYLGFSTVKAKKHVNTTVLLAIWFLGPIIASLVAVRFLIFFATPMAIGTGIIMSKMIRLSTGEDKNLAD